MLTTFKPYQATIELQFTIRHEIYDFWYNIHIDGALCL